MITISIKHLFAILEITGREAENTVGHRWSQLVTVDPIAEHTEWSAKGLLGQKPPCFLHQNFLPSSQLGRVASPIVVILKKMTTSIHGNAIKRTTSISQQASSHTCPFFRKKPHNVPPSLPALAIISARSTDFDSTILSTAVITTNKGI